MTWVLIIVFILGIVLGMYVRYRWELASLNYMPDDIKEEGRRLQAERQLKELAKKTERKVQREARRRR